MPNIKPIDAGVIAFRPSDMGVEAAAATGRRIGAFYNQAAQAIQTTGAKLGAAAGGAIREAGEAVDRHNTQNEISRGALDGEKTALNAANRWTDEVKKALADPNASSVAGMDQRFMESLEPAFDSFREGFTTRRARDWAEQRIIQMRNHLSNLTAADMSRISADQVKMSTAGTVNVATNRAFLHPSELDDVVASIDGVLDGHKDGKGNVISPGVISESRMNAADATRFSTEFRREAKTKAVNGAIQGLIRDGQPYDGVVKKYGEFLNQSAIDKYAREEHAQKSRDDTDRRRAEAEARRDAQDRSNDREIEIKHDLNSDDPAVRGKHTLKSIWEEPYLTRQSRDRLESYIRRELKPETENNISKRTAHALWAELQQPDSDHEKLLQKASEARAKDPGTPGSLSRRDYLDFVADVDGRKSPEGHALAEARDKFFRGFGKVVDGGATGNALSAAGEISVAQWKADVMRQERDMARAGGAYRPIDLYDPNSKVFVGAPERRQKYEVSMQDAINFGVRIGFKEGEPDGTRERPLIVPADRFNKDADFRATLKGKWIATPNGPRLVQ